MTKQTQTTSPNMTPGKVRMEVAKKILLFWALFIWGLVAVEYGVQRFLGPNNGSQPGVAIEQSEDTQPAQ